MFDLHTKIKNIPFIVKGWMIVTHGEDEIETDDVPEIINKEKLDKLFCVIRCEHLSSLLCSSFLNFC